MRSKDIVISDRTAQFLRETLRAMLESDAGVNDNLTKWLAGAANYDRTTPWRIDPNDPVATTAYLLGRDERRDLKHWWGNVEANAMLAQTKALQIIAVAVAEVLLAEKSQVQVRSIPTQR